MKLAVIKLNKELSDEELDRLISVWNENKNDPVFREGFAHEEFVSQIEYLSFNKKTQRVVKVYNGIHNYYIHDFGVLVTKNILPNERTYDWLKRLHSGKNYIPLILPKGFELYVEDRPTK